MCAYKHTISICQSAIYRNQTTCIGGKQISPTSEHIIVMPRGQMATRSSWTQHIMFWTPLPSCLTQNGNTRLKGDCADSMVRWASQEGERQTTCATGVNEGSRRMCGFMCLCVCLLYMREKQVMNEDNLQYAGIQPTNRKLYFLLFMARTTTK